MPYIKEAKEQNSRYYERYVNEYNSVQEANINLKFVAQLKDGENGTEYVPVEKLLPGN